MEWIKKVPKSFKGGSNIWTNMVKGFFLIENWLAWLVGSKKNVILGVDPWIGSEDKHIFSTGLKIFLNVKGLYHLVDITKGVCYRVDPQGWISTNELGLERI